MNTSVQKNQFHGSDIDRIAQAFNINKNTITNYASNVNPYGVSGLVMDRLRDNLNSISAYPDREYTELREAIAGYAGCNASEVIVGSGATELISKLISTVRPGNTVMVQPTYSEYTRDIELNGGTVTPFMLKEEERFQLDSQRLIRSLNEDVDMLILCNPNNPTSTLTGKNMLREIIRACYCMNILVMIDETYIEFVEDPEEATAVKFIQDYDNVIVIRSTSKFFAAPGLRLGYMVIGNEDLCKSIRNKQDPWSVGSLTAIAGRVMFRDKNYISDMHKRMTLERARVLERLNKIKGIKVFKPEANFVLIKITDRTITSSMLFKECIRRKMMIRDCSSFTVLGDRFIRFCFLSPDEDDELIDALNEIINGRKTS